MRKAARWAGVLAYRRQAAVPRALGPPPRIEKGCRRIPAHPGLPVPPAPKQNARGRNQKGISLPGMHLEHREGPP